MIDLHIHSMFSDGELSIESIISDAKYNNLSTISITDHDNIQSAKYIFLKKLYTELAFIPGVELSTETYYFNSKKKIHLLGYGFNCNDYKLNDIILSLYERRANDNRIYIQQLISKYPFVKEEMFENFSYGKYGWISKLILEKISSNLNKEELLTLKNYLNEVKPIYNQYNLKIEEAIQTVKNAGGYTILAHPHQLKLNHNDLDKLILFLISKGLDGIETYHKEVPKSQIRELHNIALKYGLYETGGSDFHSYKSSQCVGIGIPYPENEEFILTKKIIRENKNIGDISGNK